MFLKSVFGFSLKVSSPITAIYHCSALPTASPAAHGLLGAVWAKPFTLAVLGASRGHGCCTFGCCFECGCWWILSILTDSTLELCKLLRVSEAKGTGFGKGTSTMIWSSPCGFNLRVLWCTLVLGDVTRRDPAPALSHSGEGCWSCGRSQGQEQQAE